MERNVNKITNKLVQLKILQWNLVFESIFRIVSNEISPAGLVSLVNRLLSRLRLNFVLSNVNWLCVDRNGVTELARLDVCVSASRCCCCCTIARSFVYWRRSSEGFARCMSHYLIDLVFFGGSPSKRYWRSLLWRQDNRRNAKLIIRMGDGIVIVTPHRSRSLSND